jgi:hypothetical protein
METAANEDGERRYNADICGYLLVICFVGILQLPVVPVCTL